MLNKFRNVKFIKAMMWIVAGAFVGLIVVDWGADYTGKRGGGRADGEIGDINGEKITYQEFNNALKEAYQQAKAQSKNQEPNLGDLIRQTWNRTVAEVLFNQEIKKYNIEVSDKEVDFVNRTSPPGWVRSQEIFQTNGKFDPAKYRQFLDDPGTYSNPQGKRFVLGAESAARQALLAQKLQEQVVGGVRVTDEEVREAYRDQNEKVRVAYVGQEVSVIPDSLVSVPESDARAYYDAHKEEFQQNAGIKTSFVAFPKKPSAADEADAKSEIQNIWSDLHSGADFAKLARDRSDDPGSAQRGGDLGFFKRGQMVKPFEKVAFSLKPGQISTPFRTQYGWHIVKVDSIRGSGDSMEVRARHILIRIRPGRNTLDSLNADATEFQQQAKESGFDAAAAKEGLKVTDSGFISVGGFFPLLGNRTDGLVDRFLEASVGSVSPVFDTEEGYYVFVLRKKREAGIQPFEEVRDRIMARLKNQKKVELLAKRVAAVLPELRAGKSFLQVARAHGLRYAETKPFSRNDFVPGVGGRNAFIGAAFRLKPGELSGVVSTEGGAYVLKVLDRQPIDQAAFKKDQQQLAMRLLNQKRNEVFSEWFSNLRKHANIVDNRYRYYTDF